MNQQAKRISTEQAHSSGNRLANWLERNAPTIFLLPAVLIVLFLSIFPLILSIYLSLTRIKTVKGATEIEFVGLRNFEKILFGSSRGEFVGVLKGFNPKDIETYGGGFNAFLNSLTPVGWIVFIVAAVLFILAFVSYLRSSTRTTSGSIYRFITYGILTWLTWFMLSNLGGRPGSVTVTLCFVLIGISLQYIIGLVLALLTTQNLGGRRFFRVVFLLPMMITPVGVAYAFRMVTDTSKGPLKPFFKSLGLQDFTWVSTPWGARWAILIGDIWQWTPFLFIVLLAAVEGLPSELFEAAHVDGASRWQIFWSITMPQLIPVSVTVILIRMIEAFKIIDLPQVLTSGGPGTATQSLTLHAFSTWRAGVSGVGEATAIAYMLLFLATFIGTSYANLVHQRFSR
jgi:multiple sugar transport system permease protein